MEPNEITSLLRRYAADGCDDAFLELMKRYMDLVHGAALRRLNGDSGLAQDVVQRVFTELAREARSLRSGAGLGGWLYRRAVHLAADMHKAERRRAAREQTAAGLAAADAPAESPDEWVEAQPLLEDAIGRLPAADRNAVVLRFFENRPLRMVGAALGVSEDAAQKRITRALEKLRRHLSGRGPATTAAALATVLSNNATSTASAAGPHLLELCRFTAAAEAKRNCAVIFLHAIAMKPPAVAAIALLAVAGVAIPLLLPHAEDSPPDKTFAEVAPVPPPLPGHLQTPPAGPDANDPPQAAPLPAHRAAGIPLLPGLSEEARDATLKSARARAEKATLERFEEKMERLRRKFNLTPEQDAALTAHHRAQRDRWVEYLTGASVGEADPKFYHLDNAYRHDVPPALAEMLTPQQREILSEHETTRRANFLEASTNGELGHLALKLELDEAAKDALFARLNAINSEDLFMDYSGISDLAGIAAQADHDIARRRESFAAVLTEEQMRSWEAVAAGYRSGLLLRFGHREPEAVAGTNKPAGSAG